MFQTPILFLIFNRPDCTEKVFETIRSIKPQKLFVAADGPRIGNSLDLDLCKKARLVSTKIDWDCELNILFRDSNLGCGKSVSEAITWFFDHVEEGIILEDDCLPDPTFFLFCDRMLNRYRHNEKIKHIGGNNFQFGINRGDGDYYYSKLSHIWGWATWRRAWKNYEFNLATAKPISEESFNNAFNKNDLFINYYKYIFFEVADHKIDTWDYQWLYAIIRINGIAICPNVNLVQNIGFGTDATHTHHETTWNKLNTTKPLFSLHPPSNFSIQYEADAFFLREIIGLKEPEAKKNSPLINILVLKKVNAIFNKFVNRLKLNRNI